MSYAIHKNKLALQELDDVRRHINMLYEESIELKQENIRLNNIIKEVREYMNKHEIEEVYLDCKLYETQAYKDILEILDKGE